MDHMSVNLAFSRREKNICRYKKLQGGGAKKPIRKTEKQKKSRKMATFFLFCFFVGDSKNFVGVAKKSAGGTKW